MIRRIMVIAGFLPLGAVVNVAVAWGCSLAICPFDVKQENLKSSSRPDWFGAESVSYARRPGLGVVQLHRNEFKPLHIRMKNADGSPFDFQIDLARAAGAQGSIGSTAQPAADPWNLIPAWAGTSLASAPSDGEWMAGAGGFPLLSMMWTQQRRQEFGVKPVTLPNDRIPDPVSELRDGIETALNAWPLGLGTSVPRVLPLRPIWPGFAIDTMFYALLTWMMICGPFILRRRRRRRRGCCIHCGYELRGIESERCPECGRDRAGREP